MNINLTAVPEVTKRARGHFGYAFLLEGGITGKISWRQSVDPRGYVCITAEADDAQLHLVLPTDATKMTEMTMFAPQPGTEVKAILQARWSPQFSFWTSPAFPELCTAGSAVRRLFGHLAKCLTTAQVAEIARFCESRPGYEPVGQLLQKLAAE